MLSEVEWGDFKVGDLFEIGTGSLLSINELSKIGQVPRISAKSDNNGILGYFNTEKSSNARHFENFISVNFFGSDGGIFYHPYKASVEMKVHTLKIPKLELNAKSGAFICTSLHKALGRFDYGDQLSSSKLKNLEFKINLPVRNGEIDFDFMESFVSELESERILKLQAYLSAAGLRDYQLTSEEQKALDDLESGEFIWEEFSFQDVFDNIKQGSRLKKDDQISGNIPFVMAGVTNTGVVNYISNPVASFPKNSITVDIFGNVFYRSYDFGAGDDTGIFWSEANNYTQNTMLFIASSMGKALEKRFDYGNKLRSSQSFNIKMKLLTKNGKPDLSSMETLISAVKKLVIKDVVLYLDSKIATNSANSSA